jgi:hypothetical protein
LRPDPELTGQVYEITHLGGHRFAPTALLLPYGYLYGRLNVERTREVLSAAWDGNVVTNLLRGRTAIPDWAQVAEISVRHVADITNAEMLDVVALRQGRPIAASIITALQEDDSVQVRHHDGRAWNVELGSAPVEPRQTSCGDEPKPGIATIAESIVETDRWYR